MRVVLVDNLLFETKLGRREFDLQPHLGLISLIAAVEAAGHQGILFDPKLEVSLGRVAFDESLYRTLAEAIVQLEPDVVGFTSLGCNFICTAKIAAYLRDARAAIPILIGGPHATILDRQILERFPQFDLVLRNEAELTLPAVLQALRSNQFHSVPGVTFRHENRVVRNPGAPLISDLDTLPWPAFHAYPLETLNTSGIRVEVGRGCPFSCTFCSTASFFGRTYRLKSAERICKELDFLRSRYGAKHFMLTHDLFTVNRRKVLKFCDEIARRDYTWTCSARMDCVDSELLTRMQAAGCRSIYYGVETGSRRLQEVIRKRQDLEMFPKIVEATQRLGMGCTLSFITGYPQETAHDQEETLDLAGSGFECDEQLTNVQLHLLTPEPGTQLLQEFGAQLQYDGHISDFNFPTLEPDDAGIMAGTPEIFVTHHYYGSILPRWRHVFVTEAFNHLRELGFPVLRAILKLHQGKLSLLIDGLLSMTEAPGGRPVYDKGLLELYLSRRLGFSHILVSLVRYMLAANHLTAAAKAAQSTRALTAGRKFKLRPQTAVLRDLHDCGAALLLLASAQPLERLPGKLRKERRDYLMVVETNNGPEVCNFVLGEGTANLIQFFDRPRSRQEFLSQFGSVVENPPAVFRQLEKTVLCRSPS